MLLEDEAGFYRQPTAASSWSPRGRLQPRMRWSHRANHPIRAAVGFDPIGGGWVHQLCSRFSVDQRARFFTLLHRAYPQAERIFLVMDNWPHHNHPVARRALEEDPRVQTLGLPTYAPWLNPTEKIWKSLRQKLTPMHPDADDMPTPRSRLDITLTLANEIPESTLKYAGTDNDKLYYP